jgi:2-polyprenyl-3-methyl-5-hydroxy-6-metoxy-1,4-benzoquinol methylase
MQRMLDLLFRPSEALTGGNMDRNSWLKQQRQDSEESYSRLWAPTYDVDGGVYSNQSQQKFIQKFLNQMPQPGMILDAACGTGRYMGSLLENGRMVTGIDQAQGMLDRARLKFPSAHLQKMGLQEMDFQNVFDGAICMDAMEHVCPEDWQPILHNFHRALKPSGYFYFTVELADENDVKRAFQQGQALGLPMVPGEWINTEVYHFYPSMSQVRDWLQQAGFQILEEGEGYGYHHFLTRKV